MRQLKILVVDDDPLVLLSTVMMAEDLGHRVMEASSAHMALELVEKNVFDLVITDYAMPGMNGLQLIREINQRIPPMPVILATGYAVLLEEPLPPFLRLSKPFFETQLRDSIDAAMAQHL